MVEMLSAVHSNKDKAGDKKLHFFLSSLFCNSAAGRLHLERNK